MIADDRRPYCDLQSAICDPRSYGNQPLDRTWFYLLRSSAITIAGSQTIADLIAICDLRSAIIWKPAFRVYAGSTFATTLELSRLFVEPIFNKFDATSIRPFALGLSLRRLSYAVFLRIHICIYCQVQIELLVLLHFY